MMVKPSHFLMLLPLLLFFVLPTQQASQEEKRRKEKLFGSINYIDGHTVTCDDGAAPKTPAKFVADTWACYNIRVDGLRLRYWYLSGFGADTACGDGAETYDTRSDMAALCRSILERHSEDRPLWAAFMNDPSCDYIDENRMIYVKNDDNYYKWEEFSKGNGYFNTLRCQVHDTVQGG